MRFHINVRRWYNARGRLRTYTGAHAITPGRTRAHVKTIDKDIDKDIEIDKDKDILF